MDELLQEVKKILEQEMPELRSVQVVPHELLVETTSAFPIAALLDSGDTSQPGKTQSLERLTLTVALYQQILTDRGASVVGQSSRPGVIGLVKRARFILEAERIKPFHQVIYKGSTATRPFYHEKQKSFIAMKMAKFEYQKIRRLSWSKTQVSQEPKKPKK